MRVELPVNIQTQIIEATSRDDLRLARKILNNHIRNSTAYKNSWTSEQYAANEEIQEKIVLDYSRDELLTYMGLEVLRDRYFLRNSEGEICEDCQKFFARVATGIAGNDLEFAQQVYDLISTLKFMPATPILSNIGTTRGLTISCFLNTVEDSISGIMSTLTENAHLSKNGGGIGTNWSELRGCGAEIKTINGESSGVIPFVKLQESMSLAIHQGGLRRGSSAAYLRIDHPDIEEFLEIRKPTGGDHNRKCLEIHHGIVVTDDFMEAVKNEKHYNLIDPDTQKIVKTIDAKDIWRKVLKLRVETGEPYIMFYDTVNNNKAQSHKDLDLDIPLSNLCSEITLPVNKERTAICCLGSINLEALELTAEDLIDINNKELKSVTQTAIKILNKVLDGFIDSYKEGYGRAKYSAKRERSIGLGVMGWHGFLMKNSIPLNKLLAVNTNKLLFNAIKKHALNESIRLCEEEKIESIDTKGRANTYLLAIAPTANISVIAGGATPCIEPVTGMAYAHKTLSGVFLVKNKYLEKLLESKGQNTRGIWSSIIEAKGSVQHLAILNKEEKEVFKTAWEVPQEIIIRHAADRQKFICQSQSLNLFIPQPVSLKDLNELHFLAWESGVKTLYYVRSETVINAIIKEKGCTVCE